MESNRPEEERVAAPQEQQNVPPEAEDVVTSPGPGAEDPDDDVMTVHSSVPGPGAEDPDDDVMTVHSSVPGPGAEEPTNVPIDDSLKGYTRPGTEDPEGDVMTIHPSPGAEDPEGDVMTIHPSPGAEEPTNVPIDDSLEGYIPDYSWRDNPPEPMPEDIAEDVTDPPTGPWAEDPTDTPPDYVPEADFGGTEGLGDVLGGDFGQAAEALPGGLTGDVGSSFGDQVDPPDHGGQSKGEWILDNARDLFPGWDNTDVDEAGPTSPYVEDPPGPTSPYVEWPDDGVDPPEDEAGPTSPYVENPWQDEASSNEVAEAITPESGTDATGGDFLDY